MTRGQVAKIVSNAAGFFEVVASTQQTFTDGPFSNPFWGYIERLATRNIISGYTCGGPGEPCDALNRPYFRPYSNVTRGQLAKIVANAAGLTGTPTGQHYADVAEGQPFYPWIMRLTELGVLSGYTCGGPGEPCDAQNRPYFRPDAAATRGQTAKMVANTFFPNGQTRARK